MVAAVLDQLLQLLGELLLGLHLTSCSHLEEEVAGVSDASIVYWFNLMGDFLLIGLRVSAIFI